jgi:steroid delta-isomerase-like uncharacterized protein
MSTQENKSLVRRLMEAMNDDDFAALSQLIAPDSDQVMSWYQVFVTALPDIKHEVRATIEDDTACVVELRVTGTHTGPLASPGGEIAPTGKAFVLDYVDVARFDNGRIKIETYYRDNQSFVTQLGLA